MQSVDQEGRNIEEALEEALDILGAEAEEIDYEILDESEQGVLLRVRMKEIEELETIKNIVKDIFSEMEIDFNNVLTNVERKGVIKVDIESDSPGILIGKYGQTLDALQYIVNQIMHETRFKYIVDISGYRIKQNNKLVELANKKAIRVRQSRRKVTLNPMTSFERKIIHEAIKDFSDLETWSIGVEPERKVVISLNKENYDNNRYGNNYTKRSSYNSNYNRTSYRSSSPNPNRVDNPNRMDNNGR